MGLPRSTTLSRPIARHSFREVVECGSPMPLSRLTCGIRKPKTTVHGSDLSATFSGVIALPVCPQAAIIVSEQSESSYLHLCELMTYDS